MTPQGSEALTETVQTADQNGTTRFRLPIHGERNHQDLGNRLITPEAAVGNREGDVKCRERLGGMRSYSYRGAA